MDNLTAPGPSNSSGTPASSKSDPGFAVYVHWPFCQAKCPYCDFNSHVRHGGINEARFRSAYLAELDHMRNLTGPREVSSIFFGGGTPSRMLPETCAAILERIAKNWSVAPGTEITLEANPTSVEADRFAGFRAAGVNRASVGLQAMNDADLKALGRTHDAKEGLSALLIAKDHFERVSFDLIYARPKQTLEQWEQELARALKFSIGHMSLYQLTIEEGTPFAALAKAGKLVVPEEELARDFFVMTQQMCEAAGLPAYEVSNHAAPGQECRHNMVYWRMGDYAGIGPGAHGRLSYDSARHALFCLSNPEDWADRVLEQGHGIEASEQLIEPDIAEEYLLMGLRLSEGIELSRYASLGGQMNYLTIATLETDGLVRVDGDRLVATADGRLVLNSVIAALAG
jgi:putative oxygen-independent coproporphyrinogen III oxidase